MKLKALLLATAAIATLATSCKKDNNNGPNNGGNNGGSNAAPAASTLTAGTGYIAFNTDKAFNGATSHSFKHSGTYDVVYATNASNTATLQAQKTTVSGTTARVVSANMQIYRVTVGTADFGATAAVFSISVVDGTTSGGSATEAYAMESGTLEVTKFSGNELEGKFSGKAVNDNASINITNGTFSAKF